MKPKIKNQLAWQQAEILMQPALIRVLDNIRKQLETSIWKGSYETHTTPYPGYVLKLEHNGQQVNIDVWDLCYQVCFQDYQPTHTPDQPQEVEIDTSLLDNTGDVDWDKLDRKTQDLIEKVFANLTQP
ncbi:hypothetical protein H6G70_13420 [Arthrospira platensis FACHB-439]|uniref:hypothetical protein n=1 Tax=Limnospira platensis TaxID=118562 RepID=UPI0016873D84|nr:hypothetical protein [Arthrospira platensis FACHB-439]